jgi:hypothetical protein
LTPSTTTVVHQTPALIRIVQPILSAAAAAAATMSTSPRPTIALPLSPLPLSVADTLQATPPDQILEEEVVTEDDDELLS